MSSKVSSIWLHLVLICFMEIQSKISHKELRLGSIILNQSHYRETGKIVDYSPRIWASRGPSIGAHGVHPMVVGGPLKAHLCPERSRWCRPETLVGLPRIMPSELMKGKIGKEMSVWGALGILKDPEDRMEFRDEKTRRTPRSRKMARNRKNLGL